MVESALPPQLNLYQYSKTSHNSSYFQDEGEWRHLLLLHQQTPACVLLS